MTIGPHGRVGAASGVCDPVGRSRFGGGELGPLHVDFRLDGWSMQDALGDGRIVNDDGPTKVQVNEVILFDGATGAVDRWALNGAWEVRARTAADGGIRMERDRRAARGAVREPAGAAAAAGCRDAGAAPEGTGLGPTGIRRGPGRAAALPGWRELRLRPH